MNRDGEWSPSAQTPAFMPAGESEQARYGQVGRVPWTFAQTLLGAGVTIIPWLLLVVVSQAALGTSSSASSTRKLPPAVDILSGVAFLLFTAVVEGAFLLAPLIISIRSRAPGTTWYGALRVLGLRSTRFWPALGWVIFGLIVVYAVTIIYGALIQTFHWSLQTNGDALVQEARTMPFTVIGALIGAVVIAPFCEEIFFRGFLFAGLLRGMTVLWATLVSTALFTIVHWDKGSAIPLFAIGLMLAVIRWRTGSIWPGMALHMLNNAVASVLVVATILGAAPR
jgi:membrane protease YdiL (CAAX protease family)